MSALFTAIMQAVIGWFGKYVVELLKPKIEKLVSRWKFGSKK